MTNSELVNKLGIAIVALYLLLGCNMRHGGGSQSNFSGSPTSRKSDSFSVSKKEIVSFDELETLLPKAKDGSHFQIKNGIYKDINVSLQSSRKVVVEAQNDGRVILKGNSCVTIDKSKGLTFRGFYFDSVISKDAVVVSNSSNIEIRDNYFLRCGSDRFGAHILIRNGSFDNKITSNSFIESRAMAVVVSTRLSSDIGNTNNRIFNNLFHDTPRVTSVYPGTNGNGMESVQIGQGEQGMDWDLHTRIYRNLFSQIIGDGNEIISIKSSSNYIYHNTFIDNESGITIRLGNRCKIYENYLKNTSKGIRVFGFGHEINNNYIEGGAFSLQLPAAHFKRFDKMTHSGYYRQENIRIVNNVIVNPRKDAILIGNNWDAQDRRTLMPDNITISSNKIITQRNAPQRSLEKMGRQQSYTMTDNNIVLTESRAKTIERQEVEDLLGGFAPLVGKNVKIGAAWKR